MSDLSTSWLGQDLPHPLIPGASPLADSVDGVRQLQDAGAPLITLRSLIATPFGIAQEAQWLDGNAPGTPARSILAGTRHVPPHAADPELYCQHIERVRELTELPVVASLYARRPEDWCSLAEQFAQAGAAALELNIYGIVVEHHCNGPDVQRAVEQLVTTVRERVTLPIAVKLLPITSDFESFAGRLSQAGADGLILFNGFQRGDFQVDRIEDPQLQAASSPFDRHSRYRWLAKLCGRMRCGLAMSGGVRTSAHAARAILCGADVVQLVSKLVLDGPQELTTLLNDLDAWVDSQGYESLAEMHGVVTQARYGGFEEYDAAYTRCILQ